MFKLFIVILVAIAVCQARVVKREIIDTPTYKSEYDYSPDGSYSFHYEDKDGSFREEKAVKMNVGKDNEHLAITGSFRYLSAEGKTVTTSYTGDLRGFIITGQSISSSGGAKGK